MKKKTNQPTKNGEGGGGWEKEEAMKYNELMYKPDQERQEQDQPRNERGQVPCP